MKYIFVCIDDNDSNADLIELAVLKENYALLHVAITDIIDKCFVEEKLIATEKENKTIDIITTKEKAHLFLEKISTLLKANNTRMFYMMLKIMKEYGDKSAQSLANHISSKLKPSDDDLLQTSSDKNSFSYLKG